MDLKSAILPACALIAFPLLLAASASPASPPKSGMVWRIGSFDRSSFEFSGGSPHEPVTFVVGQSQSAKDWYAFQPAAFPSAKPGIAAAPRTIQFQIDGKPARAYRLRISLLIEQASVPALRVTLNGHSGTFYLHPQLDSSSGDTTDAFDPAYSYAAVEADFPGGSLRTGSNTIALQAVGTADRGVPDAGFNYDAVELDTLPAYSSKLTAKVEPTIFYQGRPGSLLERLNVYVRYGEQPRTGQVDLELAGRHYRKAINTGDDFGEQRFPIEVPEFAANAPARLTVKLNGHTARFNQALDPGKKWTLFLVPHVHLDIGYTDYQAKVAAIQSRILDEAMELTAKHPAFRFSTDGEWNLEQYLETRTPRERARLLEAIEHRQIYIPAEASNLLTGFPTAETLIRSLYPSADFSREHGTPFDYANITDVPSYSWSYASVLASAGLKYFLAGSDNYRAPVLLQGHLNESSPMYWEGPDGKRVLLWYSRHYMQMQLLFGLPPLTEAGEETLPLFLQMYQHPGYRADSTILFGTQVENTDLYPQQAELADQWNALHAYPHLEYSGFHDALAAIAKQFGDTLPVIRGDGGPYWEDGIGSDAFYAAMERVNVSRAPSVEKLATIGSLVNPRFAVDHQALDRMWASMVLMDEHTWTSFNSVSEPSSNEAIEQLKVKDSHASTAAGLEDWLLRGSMAGLADSIAAGPGSIVVFNTLNWQRSGPVFLDLGNGQEIVDTSTGQPVPVEVVSTGRQFHRVRFAARDVPPVGYKVFKLRPANKAAGPDKPAAAARTVLESPYYRLELDPASGAVRSIYDKQLDKELVDANSPYRFGQYLYVTGGDKAPNSILEYRPDSPKPALEIHPAAHGRLLFVERTPEGWRAEIESSARNTPRILTDIRLFEKQKKIEFVEHVTKTKVLTKEGVYFAFPFAMSHPQFQYEIQTGSVDPAKDMYAGAGHEWFSVQHWVAVQQDGVSATVMPLDASLVTLGDINRGAWPTQFGRRPGTIFSYIMNNYWNTNYSAGQGGDFRFRYIVTSAPATDAAALSRAGWEEATPLEEDEIQSQDKALDLPRPLNGKQESFLTIDDPNLLFETWKPAEDGDGTVLRLLDLGGAERTVTVTTPLLAIGKALETDAVERNPKPLPLHGANGFEVVVHPHEIVTVRLTGKQIVPSPTD